MFAGFGCLTKLRFKGYVRRLSELKWNKATKKKKKEKEQRINYINRKNTPVQLIAFNVFIAVKAVTEEVWSVCVGSQETEKTCGMQNERHGAIEIDGETGW